MSSSAFGYDIDANQDIRGLVSRDDRYRPLHDRVARRASPATLSNAGLEEIDIFNNLTPILDGVHDDGSHGDVRDSRGACTP